MSIKPSSILYRPAYLESDFEAIVTLQSQNIPSSISPAELQSQGFVTVKHSSSLLKEMAATAPQIIGIASTGELAGYALGMLQEFSDRIPVLIPMFERFSILSWANRPLHEVNFLVMGQICISKPYRGLGIFDGLYQEFRHAYQQDYELAVTQIATRNARSLRAHHRAGFILLDQYTDPRGEDWHIVALPL